MNLIQRILGKESDGLICPRCERSLEGHDDGDCASKMSRRYFFGLGAAAIALGMAPKLPVPKEIMWGGGRGGSGLILGVGDRLSVSVGSLNTWAEVLVGLESEATGEQYIVSHIVDELIDRSQFFVAPRAMKVTSVEWAFGTAGFVPGKPVVSVVRG